MRNREIVLTEMKIAVADERKSQLRVLYLLKEIESDGHFLEMGYPSLFEFATRGLGFSAGAAHRRIQTMRFLRAFPEMAEKVAEGALSLCAAAKTQGFFKNEDKKRKREGKDKLSPTAKQEIARSMVGASTKECEKKLAAISPESAQPPERSRELSHGKTLIQFSADPELVQNLEKLKGLLAHQNPGGSFEGLFKILSEIALKSVTPKPPRPLKGMEKSSSVVGKSPGKNDANIPSFSTNGKFSVTKRPVRSIPVQIKRRVFARDGGCCTYKDEKTGRQCASQFALEYDHYQTPFSWGGESSEANLTLRCRAHNLFAARRLGLFPNSFKGKWNGEGGVGSPQTFTKDK